MTENTGNIIELPYQLINIDMGDEHFSLTFKKFAKEQSEYLLRHKCVTGDFEIEYNCSGIKSKFECDITIGSLFCFYIALDDAYDIQSCRDNTVSSGNFGNSSELMLRFDKGHYFFSGCCKNKNNGNKSAVSFDFEIQQADIVEMLMSMDDFFCKIKKLQGNCDFI